MTRQIPDVNRSAALELAIAARQAQATLKKDLKAGKLDYLAVIDDAMSGANPVAARLLVLDFLKTLPAVGKVKSQKMLEEFEISPRKRLGGLGVRQHWMLKYYIDGWLYLHNKGNF